MTPDDVPPTVPPISPLAGLAVPIRPGERVGPYVVERELGRGAMGAVYLAHHAELGRTVALKVCLGMSPRAEARFLREAQASASLRHPGIVAVHDSGEAGLRRWLAMDLVEGAQSLDQRVERAGPLDPTEAARLIAAVARALEHAHQRGVLHRDIKPANILLRGGETPLLADFGLAKVVSGADSLTRTGELLGTPSFMAPEQADGLRALDARTDVWALGATLYALLAGRPPFHGDGLVQTLHRVLAANYPPLRAERPDVPRALEAIVRRCLTRRPEGRYPSAAALAADLERFLRDGTSDALTRRRVLRGASLAVAGLAVALAAAIGAVGRRARPALDPAGPAPTTSSVSPPPAPATAVTETPRRVPRPGWRARPLLEGAAPPPRFSHGLAWDPRRRCVVLYGGRDGVRILGDEWSWDGETWREETAPDGPGRRSSFAMAYDEARGRLVLHGGAVGNERLDDTWERDATGWSRVATGGGPGPRAGHALVYDPTRRRVVLFGGLSDGMVGHADLWSWDGRAWSALPPGPTPEPAPRSLFSAAWDARRDVLVVYGGRTGDAGFPGVEEWSPTRGWARRDVVGPPGRYAAAIAACPGGVVLFGGALDGERDLDDTWLFDGQRWTELPGGAGPSARGAHAMAWDAARGVVVLFGGNRDPPLADTFELDR